MIVARFHPSLGGTERQAMLLSSTLVDRGIRVYVLTRNHDQLSSVEELKGSEVHRFPLFGKSRAMHSISYILGTLLWLMIHRKAYQIIHCHQAYSPMTIGVIAKYLLNKKVITKITASNEYGEIREIQNLPFTRIRKWLLQSVDRFAVVNNRICEELEAFHIKKERVKHIPNGVIVPVKQAYMNTAQKQMRERLRLPQGRIAVFVGRLSEEKGLFTLLSAWKITLERHPEATLLIIGEGAHARSIEEDLRSEVQNLGIGGNVIFTGRVDNVMDYLLASDLFVLPSISEGMSNALLEAMAAGLAVLATDIDANRELVVDGLNGFLVEREKHEELAEKLIELLSDGELLERIGKEARTEIENRYAIEKVAEQYVNQYEELLRN